MRDTEKAISKASLYAVKIVPLFTFRSLRNYLLTHSNVTGNAIQ